jgi:hypothetical protein
VDDARKRRVVAVAIGSRVRAQSIVLPVSPRVLGRVLLTFDHSISWFPEPPRDGDALDGHVGETRLLQGGGKRVRVAERVRANNLQILGYRPELACDLKSLPWNGLRSTAAHELTSSSRTEPVAGWWSGISSVSPEGSPP